MLDRIKRKLSRTKSTVTGDDLAVAKSRTQSLTPSDEQLITKLSWAPDTELIERPPKLQTPSIATARSERTVINNTDSGILSFPTEILMFLKPYLCPSAEVALRHTCSRFFHLYSLPSFYLSGNDKLDFCCMMERDQDPRELDRLVCGRCRDIHPKSAFAASEVPQQPLERDCRQVWLCAHRYLGYRKTIRNVKAGVEAPFRSESLDPCSKCREVIRNRAIAERPEKGTREIDIEHPGSQSLLISKIAIMQRPSPSHNRKSQASGMYVETFPVKEVSDALQAINFRLCPHLCLGDPSILSKFCRGCLNTQRLAPGAKGPPCIAEGKGQIGGGKCKGTCYVRGCKTKFMFQSRESLAADSSGKRQVWLIISVYRWLGPLLTAERDSSWTEHSVDTHERAQMRQAWAQWEKSDRNRQFIPNWSICLLHPDDCRLNDFGRERWEKADHVAKGMNASSVVSPITDSQQMQRLSII